MMLGKRLTFLPFMLGVTAVVAVVAPLVAWVAVSPAAALGVLAGVGLVGLSYLLSSFVIAWADSINPKMVLSVGLLMYGIKFTVLFLVLAVIAKTGWAGLKPMAIGIGVAAVAWTIGHGWWLWHARIPYIDDPE
ncbi:hypothetical protein CS0771_21590 [Catellatospora sp. IY07-71]|uniref:hypothetical protein n=1 Tax=Catellatospora sp. IY07-71 TaxID=2728827 RepID=UPI001BB432A4|nr:hypothetical protein [Catellatospora sp. IY07-71]BCJ72615.1 hypothetical protein CS0771_21590 [Catellatospora sp. IY07-71]